MLDAGVADAGVVSLKLSKIAARGGLGTEGFGASKKLLCLLSVSRTQVQKGFLSK